MAFTPQSLKDLRVAFVAWTGCPTENFSIARGCSPGRGFRGFHLGRDQIFGSQSTCTGEKWNDYSVKTARDKAGLTDARSAIDIQFNRNTLDRGAAKLLHEFSTWLACRSTPRCRSGSASTAVRPVGMDDRISCFDLRLDRLRALVRRRTGALRGVTTWLTDPTLRARLAAVRATAGPDAKRRARATADTFQPRHHRTRSQPRCGRPGQR